MIALFATDLAHGFGMKGYLPWRKVPEDMNHFRGITYGKYIVMGYNTWKTLPNLPNRKPIVISRKEISKCLTIPNNNYVTHLKNLEIELGEEVIVIGGAATLTPELLNECSSIYHTSIKGTFPADTSMSADSMATLKLREQEEILVDTPHCIIRKYT